MSMRYLRTLVAIAESGSFAAAARKVHLTQSAVSMHVQALEETLGIALFDRSKRPPVLNRAGTAFVPQARKLIADYDRAMRFSDAPDTISGHLRLGAVPSTMTGSTPQALAALRRKHPDLHVALSMGLSAELVDQIARDSLDAAIVSDLREPHPGLEWRPFAHEPLVVIAPLEATEPTAEALLAAHPFIRYARPAWVGELIDDVLRRRGLAVNETMTLNTLEAIATMVFYGFGVSVVPQPTIGPPFPLPLRRVALARPTVHRVLGLVRPQAAPTAQLTDALWHELRALAAGDSEGGEVS